MSVVPGALSLGIFFYHSRLSWLISPCSLCCHHLPVPKNIPAAEISFKIFSLVCIMLLSISTWNKRQFVITCPIWNLLCFHSPSRFNFTIIARNPTKYLNITCLLLNSSHQIVIKSHRFCFLDISLICSHPSLIMLSLL